MNLLTKEQIASGIKLGFEDVEVPEFNGVIRVSEMTVGAHDEYQSSMMKIKDGKVEQNFKDMTSNLLSRCIVDADGKQMFSPDDIRKWPHKITRRLMDVAQRLNGDTKDEVDKLEKN